jgi:hypothetical protein
VVLEQADSIDAKKWGTKKWSLDKEEAELNDKKEEAVNVSKRRCRARI